jgi:hypothetical protein
MNTKYIEFNIRQTAYSCLLGPVTLVHHAPKCAELHLQLISTRYFNYQCNLPERCLLYWLWLSLPENWWSDYIVWLLLFLVQLTVFHFVIKQKRNIFSYIHKQILSLYINMHVSTYSCNILLFYWPCQVYVNCICFISLSNVFAQQLRANNFNWHLQHFVTILLYKHLWVVVAN